MTDSLRHAHAAAVAEHLTTVLAAGWSELRDTFGHSAVETARALGWIQTVLPGIYAASEGAASFHARARAITVWTAPTGAITGLAGAHLWGVVDAPAGRITVQVPPAWHHRVPSWVRLLRVPACQGRSDADGIARVPAPDAVVQSWREARPDVGAATVIAAVQRGITSASEVLDALARRKQMSRRDDLQQLVAVAGTRVTSYLEWVAWRDVFPPHLYPHLRWQVPKWTNGRKRVFDAWDAEAGIDLEFDGGSTHGGVDGFERDRERDADVRAEGWEPLHFTYRDLTQRPEWCRAVYEALRAARLRGPQQGALSA